MKRGILALAGLVALLALPVAATGDSGNSAAKGQPGSDFEVSFTLKTLDGEPVALKNFRYKKLEALCDGGVTARIRGKFPLIEVNDRNRFSESTQKPNKKVRVKGRVSRDLDTVRGTIRARGDFDPTAQNCDSEKVRWKAT